MKKLGILLVIMIMANASFAGYLSITKSQFFTSSSNWDEETAAYTVFPTTSFTFYADCATSCPASRCPRVEATVEINPDHEENGHGYVYVESTGSNQNVSTTIVVDKDYVGVSVIQVVSLSARMDIPVQSPNPYWGNVNTHVTW